MYQLIILAPFSSIILLYFGGALSSTTQHAFLMAAISDDSAAIQWFASVDALACLYDLSIAMLATSKCLSSSLIYTLYMRLI
jgi:hypothetical protein